MKRRQDIRPKWAGHNQLLKDTTTLVSLPTIEDPILQVQLTVLLHQCLHGAFRGVGGLGGGGWVEGGRADQARKFEQLCMLGPYNLHPIKKKKKERKIKRSWARKTHNVLG